MSDTVKLIIEIPKEMMKALEAGNFGSKYNPYDVCWLVRNGIPLDDVVDNIKADMKDMFDSEELFEIIDKHIGKAESEE